MAFGVLEKTGVPLKFPTSFEKPRRRLELAVLGYTPLNRSLNLCYTRRTILLDRFSKFWYSHTMKRDTVVEAFEGLGYATLVLATAAFMWFLLWLMTTSFPGGTAGTQG